MGGIRLNFKQFLLESGNFDLNVKQNWSFGDLLNFDAKLKSEIQEMLMEEALDAKVYRAISAGKMSHRVDVVKGRPISDIMPMLRNIATFNNAVLSIARFRYFKADGFDSSSYTELPIYIFINDPDKNKHSQTCYCFELDGGNWSYSKLLQSDAITEIFNTTHNYDLFREVVTTGRATIPINHNDVYAWIPFS